MEPSTGVEVDDLAVYHIFYCKTSQEQDPLNIRACVRGFVGWNVLQYIQGLV